MMSATFPTRRGGEIASKAGAVKLPSSLGEKKFYAKKRKLGLAYY
jgi:hypothetical protein